MNKGQSSSIWGKYQQTLSRICTKISHFCSEANLFPKYSSIGNDKSGYFCKSFPITSLTANTVDFFPSSRFKIAFKIGSLWFKLSPTWILKCVTFRCSMLSTNGISYVTHNAIIYIPTMFHSYPLFCNVGTN